MSRKLCCAGLLSLGLCLGPPAQAGEGLTQPDGQVWSQWQGRISLQSSAAPLWRADLSRGATAGLKVQSFGLLGDYYFMQAALSNQGAGGFRATTGVLMGGSTSLWSGATATSGSGLSLAHRQTETLPIYGGDSLGDNVAPYIGVGYSGLTSRGGWGFAADLGLMALTGESRLRLSGERMAPGLDEQWRDLRITPVLQLGVSYSF